jgi:hypothetical protein
MEFQIFSKVPAPPQKRGPGFGVRESKYPFNQLEIDDVLVIPGTTSKNFGPTVRAAEQRLPGFYFTVRTGPVMVKGEDGTDIEVVPKGAVGVWRVAGKAPRKPQKARTAEEKAAAAAKAKVTREKNKAAKAAAQPAQATG